LFQRCKKTPEWKGHAVLAAGAAVPRPHSRPGWSQHAATALTHLVHHDRQTRCRPAASTRCSWRGRGGGQWPGGQWGTRGRLQTATSSSAAARQCCRQEQCRWRVALPQPVLIQWGWGMLIAPDVVPSPPDNSYGRQIEPPPALLAGLQSVKRQFVMPCQGHLRR